MCAKNGALKADKSQRWACGTDIIKNWTKETQSFNTCMFFAEMYFANIHFGDWVRAADEILDVQDNWLI